MEKHLNSMGDNLWFNLGSVGIEVANQLFSILDLEHQTVQNTSPSFQDPSGGYNTKAVFVGTDTTMLGKKFQHQNILFHHE